MDSPFHFPEGETHKKPTKNNKLEIMFNVTPSPLGEGPYGLLLVVGKGEKHIFMVR